MVPDVRMIENLNSAHHLKVVVSASVNAASSSFSALSQLSEVDKFYWHFIALCCNHVQLGPDNLSKLNTYLFMIEKLSRVYHEYCNARNSEKSVIHTVPQEIDRIGNADIKDYFKWIVKMQKIMIHWQSKFINHEFNYDDIFLYASNLPSIISVAKSVCSDYLVYSPEEVTEFKEKYSRLYANLCSLLIKSNKEHEW